MYDTAGARVNRGGLAPAGRAVHYQQWRRETTALLHAAFEHMLLAPSDIFCPAVCFHQQNTKVGDAAPWRSPAAKNSKTKKGGQTAEEGSKEVEGREQGKGNKREEPQDDCRGECGAQHSPKRQWGEAAGDPKNRAHTEMAIAGMTGAMNIMIMVIMMITMITMITMIIMTWWSRWSWWSWQSSWSSWSAWSAWSSCDMVTMIIAWWQEDLSWLI